jgi:hypothetical protein
MNKLRRVDRVVLANNDEAGRTTVAGRGWHKPLRIVFTQHQCVEEDSSRHLSKPAGPTSTQGSQIIAAPAFFSRFLLDTSHRAA